MQAVRPGLIELHNEIMRCKNLNQHFGWHLTPADLGTWDAATLEVAEAMMSIKER